MTAVLPSTTTLLGFREWLDELDRLGDVQRIDAEVDWNLEMGAIIRRGLDLRAPLRAGATDAELTDLVRAVWERRFDRYSELRDELRARGVQHAEMNYLGG